MRAFLVANPMLEALEKFRAVFGQKIKTMDVGNWQPEDVETDGE